MKPDDLDKLKSEISQWEKSSDLKSVPERLSEAGIPLKTVYTPLDTREESYLGDIGLPGQYPYTRGVYPSMYRIRPWAMRLYSGFGTAEDTNERWKFLLNAGNNGVACAFDLATQMGMDSDNPEAEDEVGRLGVAIDTLSDMEILYKGLPLDKIVSSFNINAPAAIILAMYIALGEMNGIAPQKLSGTLSNDILCEYVSRGMWVFPISPALRLTTDIVEYCTRHMPKFYPFNIRGIIMREAGASMVQEAAFAFCNASTYIQNAIERGLNVDEFCPRVSFFFATGTKIFEEAARYRAARRVWAKIMKNKFGAKNPASMLFRFTGTVGGSNYRAQEPMNNLVRGAYGLLANILGGAQGMLHPALDEPFAIPTEETAKLALRTQQILAYETGITDVADPLGGSYLIESLTDSLEAAIEKLMVSINDMGGSVLAVERGFMQQCIADEAYKMAMEEKSGKRVIVGVNKFRDKTGSGPGIKSHKHDVTILSRQVSRLTQIRKDRDNSAVRKSLDRLKDEARGTNNLMPCLIETVKTYASLGEIMDTLREVYGQFREPKLF